MDNKNIRTDGSLEAPKGFGNLVITILKEGTATPVSGAKVEISDMNGTKITSLKTDTLGNTDKIKLPAPLQSEDQIIKPYSKYIATVTHPDYTPTEVIGLHIYNESTAIPEIEIKTINRNGGNSRVIKRLIIEEFDGNSIHDHSENPYKISEPVIPISQISQPLPSLPSFPSVPSPSIKQGPLYGPQQVYYEGLTIPEKVRVFIVKENRTVDIPFLDYIKGVAHSEFEYFNEDEAVIANVIAIISFTLNRIYTQFYRVQGFDYDITTTGKDQKYKDKKTYTPQEIIVRHIEKYFYEYIKYPNSPEKPFKFQPFLSQYCDGNKTKCASEHKLEQIPSLELAKNKKMKYQEILQHFYGKNTETVRATSIVVDGRIIGIIQTLKLGDRGTDVKLIQQYLNVLGKRYKMKIYEEAELEDQYFGKKTEAAVRAFQKHSMKLPENKITGIVDQGTWYKLIILYSQKDKRYTRSNKNYFNPSLNNTFTGGLMPLTYIHPIPTLYERDYYSNNNSFRLPYYCIPGYYYPFYYNY